MPVYSSLKGICDSTRQVLSVSYGFSPVQGRSTIHLTKFSLCPTGLVLSKKREEYQLRHAQFCLYPSGLLFSEKNLRFEAPSPLYIIRVYSSLRKKNLRFGTCSPLYIRRLYSSPMRICDSTRQVLFASSVFTPFREECQIRHGKSSLHPPCLLLSKKKVRFDTSSPLCILRIYSSPKRKSDSTRQIFITSSVFTPLRKECQIRHVNSSLYPTDLLLS